MSDKVNRRPRRRETDEDPRYSAAEAESRRTRPPTRTLGEAFSVFRSYPTPGVLLGLLGASTAWRALRGRPAARELAIPLAVAAYWPLQEWFLHRYVLHIKPFRIGGVEVDPYFARRHREHHANPADFENVFLPRAVVLGSYLVFGGLHLAATRSDRRTATLMASLASAALVYEWTHFMTHSDYRPTSEYAKKVWRYHQLHHYRNEHRWYGFTVPWVDDALGTGGGARDVEASGTTRTLGVPPREAAATTPRDSARR